MVSLDIKKAFEKVPYRRFFVKVRTCGVAGQVVNWSAHWLSERKQRVAVSGRMSCWEVLRSLRDQYSDHYSSLFTSTIWIMG